MSRASHIQPMNATYDDTYDDMRKAVLDAALPELAFDGWSEEVLARAGKAAGLDDNSLHLAFSGGVGDLIAAFSKSGDAAMLAALETPDDMKIRDRIRHAVRVRLEADTDHREARAARRVAELARTTGFGRTAGLRHGGSYLALGWRHRHRL